MDRDPEKKGRLGVFKQRTVVWWAWTFAEYELIRTMFQGFMICFPLCFAVLFAATGNWILSFFSVYSIAQIVCVVLGTIR